MSQSRHSRRVLIANTEPSLIGAVLVCCRVLGIHALVYATPRPPPRRQAWEVNITGQRSLRLLAEEVPLRSEAKAAKLAAMVGSYQRPASERYHVSHDEAKPRGAAALRLRLEEGLSWRVIGERIGMTEGGACGAARRAAERAGVPPPQEGTDPRLVASRTAEASRLRAEGLSYPQIAKRMDMSKNGAYKAALRGV